MQVFIYLDEMGVLFFTGKKPTHLAVYDDTMILQPTVVDVSRYSKNNKYLLLLFS